MELQQQAQIDELKKAMRKTKNWRFNDRYPAVNLNLSGYNIKEISRIIGHTHSIIDCHVAVFRNGGIELLIPRHSQEINRRFNRMQEAELKAIILTKLPSEVGFESHSNWTYAFMVVLVKQK